MTQTEDHIYKKVEQYLNKVYGKVMTDPGAIERTAQALLDVTQTKPQMLWLSRAADLEKYKSGKVLDYGCGTGNLVLHLCRLGFSAEGFEVDPDLYEIARLRKESAGIGNFDFSREGIINSRSNTYDLIFSYFVLEHVKNPETYFSEALRVLKPGGKAVFVTCNYLLNYEFHYCMFLPLFSRSLSRLMLRLAGRDTEFFDGLSILTPGKLMEILHKLKGKTGDFTVENVGKKFFLADLLDPTVHSSLFIKYAKLLQKIKLPNSLLKLGFYNPVVLTITKTGN